jgi:hypothetical protein
LPIRHAWDAVAVAEVREHSDDRPLFAELDGLSLKELRGRYDYVAQGEGQRDPLRASFYLEEIRRHESAYRQRWMLALTIAIAILTLVTVAAFVADYSDRHHHERHQFHGYTR